MERYNMGIELKVFLGAEFKYSLSIKIKRTLVTLPNQA